MEENSLKKLISLSTIFLIYFLLHCLKAERSPFDISNRSSVTGSFLIAATGNNNSNQTTVSNNPTNTGGTNTSSNTPSNTPSIITFQYSQSTFTMYTGTSISILAPSVSGGTVSSFSISPSLPTGLTLNGSTGAIAGTPMGSAVNQDYTITGKTQVADVTTTITLKIGSSAASSVFGQTSFTLNGGGSGTNSLNGPYDLTFDSAGKLYVADTNNNRVVAFAPTSSSAIQVFGQLGSFSTTTVNNGGISPDSLSSPRGVTVDSTGNLYISDYSNNRVLYFVSGSTTATRVYGQLGAYNTLTINNGGVTADSNAGPYRSTVDSAGNLYVPNVFTHRVLFYATGSTTATRVYGQLGIFTSNTANNGGISADSLNAPTGCIIDSSGNLYIADRQNNRVLFYLAGSTTATRVYGQLGSFTSNTANNGGITADSLNAPTGIAMDSTGNLYVADSLNNRVLFFPVGSTTATRVYGQLDSFTSNTANNGGVSASSLNTPYAVAISNNKLHIADNGNNRIVVFYIP
jgi:sugar lactone lactonase YvrE